MDFFVSLLATRLNEASVYMSTWCQSIRATEEPGGNRNRMVKNKAQPKYLKVYYKKILHFVATCNIIRK